MFLQAEEGGRGGGRGRAADLRVWAPGLGESQELGTPKELRKKLGWAWRGIDPQACGLRCNRSGLELRWAQGSSSLLFALHRVCWGVELLPAP